MPLIVGKSRRIGTIRQMQAIDPAPRSVIFDLDGTLVDSFGLVIHAWNVACREPMGRTYTNEEVIARFGLTDIAMLRRELKPQQFEKAKRVFLDEYRARHRELCTIFEGIDELLDELHSRKVPMGIMTGKGRDTADITLAEIGWSDRFKSVVTGDEVSKPKPDPEGPLRVARELGIEPRECVFVGDSPADILAGRAAGMRTIWAGWHPVYEEKIRKLRPDYSAMTPEELKRLLVK
jgi:phosphoglycolate phosphatase/pyrophosphatase PpaX